MKMETKKDHSTCKDACRHIRSFWKKENPWSSDFQTHSFMTLSESQNCFHYNSKILFIFFTVLTFAYLLQKQCGYNYCTHRQLVALNCTDRHCIQHSHKHYIVSNHKGKSLLQFGPFIFSSLWQGKFFQSWIPRLMNNLW